MDYKVVFLDIDGTILPHNERISDKTKKAVSILKNKGIEVVIATGRPLCETTSIAKELNIESMVTFNGPHLIYNKEIIYHQPLSSSLVQNFVNLAKQKDIPVALSREESNFIINRSNSRIQEVLNGYKFRQSEFDGKVDGTYQMLLFCDEQEEVEFTNSFKELKLIRWHKHCCDVMSHNSSKVLGIKKLLEHLQISPEKAVAFGDGLNDIEMLSFVGMGVAMGNANPKLIPYANLVTTSVSEDGVYNGLKKLNLI